MLLFIVDEQGVRRELSRADLERLPQQEVYRSAQLKDLSIGTVRLSALLDQLLPSRAVRSLAAETDDGGRESLAAKEIEGALLVYRLGVGSGGPLRLMLVSGGQIVSVQRLRGIHLSDEQCAAVAHDAA